MARPDRPRTRSRRSSRLEVLESRRLLATLTVNTTQDANARDAVLSLREAILVANGSLDPATLSTEEAAQVVGSVNTGPTDRDQIHFDIPAAGVQTITLSSALPTIIDPVVIDGYTQSDASPNTLPDGNDAVLRVQIDRAALAVNGLTITAGSSTVRGLVINGNISFATYAIELRTSGGNRVEGNFLGVDPSGTAGGGMDGGAVHIQGTADNVIGGTTPAARNVVVAGSSSQATQAIVLDSNATRNLIQGNFVGTNAGGTNRLVNGGTIGLFDAPGNTIGGTIPGARNVVSPQSNTGSGIFTRRGNGNLIQGNHVGIDVTGTTAIGVGFVRGIEIIDASNNTVGGAVEGARNVISGNGSNGLVIASTGTSTANNVVQGNYIGTDASGLVAVPNSSNPPPSLEDAAVRIFGDAPGTIIGGTTPEARNIIAGNGASGISIEHGTSPGLEVIQGNWIGVNAAGQPLGNAGHGIRLSTGSAVNGATIGGTAPGAGNVIAHNALKGVVVYATAGSSVNTRNSILSNSIFGNGGLGIDLGGDGVTGIDPGDADLGANNLQNTPTIATVASSAGSTTITGTLDSAPGTYRVEFFASDAADASSSGEGQTFLGFLDVTVAGGPQAFTATIPADVGPTQFVTATATDSNGNTSEFSALVADLAVAMTDSVDPAQPGRNITYTITVTNHGERSPSGPVVLTDTLPPNVTFVSATDGVTPTNGVVRFELGVLAIGESRAVTVTVRPLLAAVGTTLTNRASVSSPITDPDANNNATAETTEVVEATGPQSDLSVSFTSTTPNPVAAGENLTYTITVNNAGPDPSDSASLRFETPENTRFVSFTAPPGWFTTTPAAGATGAVTALFPLLGVAQPAVFTVVVRVDEGTPNGTRISATATIDQELAEANQENNQADASTQVAPGSTLPTADLRLTKTPAPGPVLVGQDLVYTLTLTNAGPDDLPFNIVILDTLPQGATFVSATGGVVPDENGRLSFSIVGLDDGATRSVQVVVRPNGVGSLTNTATVLHEHNDPDTTNDTATAQTEVLPDRPDLVLTKLSTGDAVRVGQNITYVLTITNRGGVAAGDALVRDTLPANVTFVSATGGAVPSADRVLLLPAGDLAPGQSAQFTVVVRADAPGAIVNSAVADSAVEGFEDFNPADNAASASLTVLPADATPPTVASVARYGFHRQATYLVVTFSEPMDPAAAAEPASYLVLGRGPDHRLGTRDDLRFAPATVAYNPETNQAILRMASRLSVFRAYRLVLSGSGLRDLAGNALDGDGDGAAGGNARVTINRHLLAGTEADAIALLPPRPDSTPFPRGPRRPRARVVPRT
jgi:uncharacterized repeat protein (TIGR01451 family)